MSRVADALRRGTELVGVSDSPRLDLELLLAHALGRPRTWLYTWPEAELDALQQSLFEQILARRKRGEPMAHILGQREFWSLSLAVDASTLIPRPDSERLVELALALTEHRPRGRALDLGTGTGALALAFASERPDWQVLAVDRSAEAVALAERNRRRLGLSGVSCQQSDWFSALEPGFDLIMSNPPYIEESDPHLSQGDLRFEPRDALVAGPDGLADIETIVDAAPVYLERDGWLLIEHGWQQGEPVRALFHRSGFRAVRTEQDLGGQERVTLGQLPEEA